MTMYGMLETTKKSEKFEIITIPKSSDLRNFYTNSFRRNIIISIII